MKVAILVLTFITLSSASPSLREQWSSFKAQFGKSYDSEKEEQFRLSVFSENLKTIEEHNVNYKSGLVTYYMKLNKFADLTTEEYHALLTVSGERDNQEVKGLPYLPPANVKIPESIDWRTKGAVTPVMDQGPVCGSGWSFSTNGTCKFQLQKAVQGSAVKSYVELDQGDVKALESAAGTVGPISIAISAGSDGFRHYGGGVFDGSDCDPFKLNHAVLIVGYASESGKDYWIIKNSLGTKWGEEGCMKLEKKNYENICGISFFANYPVF